MRGRDVSSDVRQTGYVYPGLGPLNYFDYQQTLFK